MSEHAEQDRDILTLVWVVRELERACSDLTLPQYRLLALIVRGEERASSLAGQLALARPTVSAAVETLVANGMVARTSVDGDRRAVHLTITPAGAQPCRSPSDAETQHHPGRHARPVGRRGRARPARAPSARRAKRNKRSTVWKSAEQESAPHDEGTDRAGLDPALAFPGTPQAGRLVAFGVAILGRSSLWSCARAARSSTTITTQTEPVGPAVVLLVGLAGVNFLFQYIQRYSGGRYGIDVQNDLRNALFERLQRLDFARHDELPTGQLVSRASSDLQLVQQLLQFMPMLTGNVILLVLSLFFMLLMSPLSPSHVPDRVQALLLVSLRLRKKMYPRGGTRWRASGSQV